MTLPGGSVHFGAAGSTILSGLVATGGRVEAKQVKRLCELGGAVWTSKSVAWRRFFACGESAEKYLKVMR